ncbi:MAG: hypothetical protein ABI113_05285 [Mucilaginibacter sp.]
MSWSQYKIIIRLDTQHKREFYIAEAIKNNWTYANWNAKSIVVYGKDY